jgi:hypothetical protein
MKFDVFKIVVVFGIIAVGIVMLQGWRGNVYDRCMADNRNAVQCEIYAKARTGMSRPMWDD